jgi:hypothetical protein
MSGEPSVEQFGKFRDRVRPFAHDLSACVEESHRVNVPRQATPRAAMKEASLEERLKQRPEAECVSGRYEVDCAAHQSGPDGLSRPDEVRELFVPEALEPRPQPDIGKVGRLGLHADEALDRRGGREPDGAKEHLARQQRAIQRAPAEDLGGSGHGPIVGSSANRRS